MKPQLKPSNEIDLARERRAKTAHILRVARTGFPLLEYMVRKLTTHPVLSTLSALALVAALAGCREETVSVPPRPQDPLELPPGFEFRCSIDGRYASALKGASNFLTVAHDPSKVGAANAAWFAYWNGWKTIPKGFDSDGSTNKPFYYSCE